jgi:hypothetical protein
MVHEKRLYFVVSSIQQRLLMEIELLKNTLQFYFSVVKIVVIVVNAHHGNPSTFFSQLKKDNINELLPTETAGYVEPPQEGWKRLIKTLDDLTKREDIHFLINFYLPEDKYLKKKGQLYCLWATT